MMNSEWYKWEIHKVQKVDEKMGIPIFWDADLCKYEVQGNVFSNRKQVFKYILNNK